MNQCPANVWLYATSTKGHKSIICIPDSHANIAEHFHQWLFCDAGGLKEFKFVGNRLEYNCSTDWQWLPLDYRSRSNSIFREGISILPMEVAILLDAAWEEASPITKKDRLAELITAYISSTGNGGQGR